jgi:NitT/TauT family transport system permease protein
VRGVERVRRLATSRVSVTVYLLLAWELAVRLRHVSDLVLPPPSEVLDALAAAVTRGDLLRFTGVTLEILLAGMLLGVAGALVFTVLGVSTVLGRQALIVLTSALNPLPAIAVLPLAVLWFGFGPRALVFVIVNSVIWAMALNMYRGFEMVPQTVRYVGQNLGLGGWRLIRDIYLPSALPHILTGFKVAWAYGWRTIIASELVFGASGSNGGLGWFIFMARYNLETPTVFAGLVAIILIGLAVESLFLSLEARTIRRWGMTA